MFYNIYGDFIIKEDFAVKEVKKIGDIINKEKKEFKCPSDTYNYEGNNFIFTKDIFNFTINDECLVLPGRVWNAEKKRVFTVTMADPGCDKKNCSATGNHGYEIFIMNPPDVSQNIINVDIIKPNFFCIVNTKYMNNNGGIIKFITNKNNEKLRFILINNMKDNDEYILDVDKVGNKCTNLTSSINRYDYVLSSSNQNLREISYNNNPRIYILGDYRPCDESKIDQVKNVYIYLDYGLTPDITNKCLGKLKLNKILLDVKAGLSLKENHHGFIFNTIARKIIIDFDPRGIIGRNGFLTVINVKTEIKENEILDNGSIEFSNLIINNLLAKKKCYYVRFWLADINLNSDGKIVDDVVTRKGPYKSISFTENPKIIIYIPPHIFKPVASSNVKKITPVETEMTNEEINIRTVEYASKNVQIQEKSVLDVLDIYVGIIY